MIPDPQAEGDFEQMGLGARGESAERIHSVRPAAAIVKDMMREGARDCGRKGEEQEDVHKGLCMVDAGPRTALLAVWWMPAPGRRCLLYGGCRPPDGVACCMVDAGPRTALLVSEHKPS
ncbi:MAG TPA: hypothetical protein VGA56_09655, partial [Opitutaceae bacterium]